MAIKAGVRIRIVNIKYYLSRSSCSTSISPITVGNTPPATTATWKMEPDGPLISFGAISLTN